MDSYEYFIAPFVGKIKTGLFSNESSEIASQQLLSFIQHYQGQGWEFDRLGTIHILVQPGCLASFLGARASTVVLDQVIFKRVRSQATLAVSTADRSTTRATVLAEGASDPASVQAP